MGLETTGGWDIRRVDRDEEIEHRVARRCPPNQCVEKILTANDVLDKHRGLGKLENRKARTEMRLRRTFRQPRHLGDLAIHDPRDQLSATLEPRQGNAKLRPALVERCRA